MPDAFSRSSCGMKHRGQIKYLRESSLVEAKVPKLQQESSKYSKKTKKIGIDCKQLPLFRVRDTSLQLSRSGTSSTQASRFSTSCRVCGHFEKRFTIVIILAAKPSLWHFSGA